jgi:hypothetical protein
LLGWGLPLGALMRALTELMIEGEELRLLIA